MKLFSFFVFLVCFYPGFAVGEYGTPTGTDVLVFSPWEWDDVFSDVFPLVDACLGSRGYSVPNDYADPVLDLTAVSVNTWVTEIRSAPGIVMIFGHGDVTGSNSEGWFTVCCYSETSAGLIARNEELDSAQSDYGNTKVRGYHDQDDHCYCIQIKDTLLVGTTDYSGTFGYFGMCYGKQHAEQAMPTAKCAIGYAGVNGSDTLYDELVSITSDLVDDENPKNIGATLSGKTIKFAAGSDETLQVVPWMVGHSVEETGNVVTADGLDFWIEIRGALADQGSCEISSDHFSVDSSFRTWHPTTKKTRIHALLFPKVGDDYSGWGDVIIDCNKVISSDCSDLVLNGANDNSIVFSLQNGVNPAAHISGFSVVAGTAQWTGIPFKTDHFFLEGGNDPVNGLWEELVQIPPYSDSENYLVDVSSFSYPYFRLSEVETNGGILFHSRAEATTSVSLSVLPHPLSIEDLELKLETLALNRDTGGYSLHSPLEEGTAVVFFTIGDWIDAVQAHVADYWQNNWGYDTYVENVDDFPVTDPDNRNAWRTHMQERIAFYYNNHNVRYVHFIGGANDWEMWSQPWPDGEWASNKAHYNAVGYPPDGQPELDHIPCFYILDDVPPDNNTAGWTWWIPSDAPYKDITGDGSPDIAFGRWPVNSLEGVLANALTMQTYNNCSFVSIDNHVVEMWTGELQYGSPMDSLLVMQAAASAADEIPDGVAVSYMKEADYPDIGFRNLEAASRLNSHEISVLGMFADNSGRRYPCKQFDNSAAIPFTMDLLRATVDTPYIMAMSCGATDFQRTNKPTSAGPICELMGEAPNKGFIAMLGPMCGTWQSSNEIIGTYAMRELWAGNDPDAPRSLAMSWTKAETDLLTDFFDDYGTRRTLLSYNFLGDPLSPLLQPCRPVGINEDGLPARVMLGGNYPNPFNPSTTIRFTTIHRDAVKLIIYDLAGRKVRTLINNELDPGEHEVVWHGDSNSGRRVASGTYFCRLETEGKTFSQKMMVIK